ncbi:MAG TPA: hypothetical protein PK695_06095 [Chitinophagaceae bacterium]|jgi:hypothetical protein|nr:MAG: hypothetical protein BWZ05_01781 [Bacteroidetes bacterium ADurb.BinA245]HMW66247.1 hypothetical protein [Chitinophagaceae bacterium]HNA19076.1 hypothetical protein [Chitinophagaceae bacterium]HNA91314.1 hypothetical protein [Chitinophagaceae bacterium]HNA96097.1 hypothetical protein [Chitinophagaceae bacterium]
MNNLIKFAAVSLSLAFSLSTNAQSSEDMPPATKKAVNTTVVAKNENVKPSVSDPMSSNAKGPDFNKPVQQKPEVQTKPENPTKPVVAPADVVTTKKVEAKTAKVELPTQGGMTADANEPAPLKSNGTIVPVAGNTEPVKSEVVVPNTTNPDNKNSSTTPVKPVEEKKASTTDTKQ